MQEEAHHEDAASMSFKRSLHYRREGGINQEKGCLCNGVLKVISDGKNGGRREFQFLEVMRTNLLANDVVRHFPNLTAKGCWKSAQSVLSAKHALGLINSSEHMS